MSYDFFYLCINETKMCTNQNSGNFASYFTDRPSPPYFASKCGGKILPGNDGNKYISVQTNKQTQAYAWKLMTTANKSVRKSTKRQLSRKSTKRSVRKPSLFVRKPRKSTKRRSPRKSARKSTKKRSPRKSARKSTKKRSPRKSTRKSTKRRSRVSVT